VASSHHRIAIFTTTTKARTQDEMPRHLTSSLITAANCYYIN